MKTWREELAWAAGFFDGEGHIGFTKSKRHDLYVTISQIDRTVLDRFQAAVGFGKVTGPYVRSYRNPNEHDVYYYQLARFEYVQAVVAVLWEFLSPIKRAQSAQALVAMRERVGHKPTCKNGHPRDDKNLHWTANGKWRLCRQCQRDKDKKRRGNLKLVAGLEDWT